MEIQASAAMAVQAMALGDTREVIAQVQANPLPASAPASAHADVILRLSSAAQALTSGS